MLRELGRVALAAVVGVGLLAAWTTYRITAQGGLDEQRPADAIVVLGAAQYDGRPSPVFAARLDHALALYRKGLAPLLVVTGGREPGDRTTEAASARAYALARGVPAAAILSEDQGRTTLESLEAVASLLRARGLHTAVFVSDPTHILRVLRIAADEGLRGWGSPTRTSPIEADPDRHLAAVAHELAALGLYFVGGGHWFGGDPPFSGG